MTFEEFSGIEKKWRNGWQKYYLWIAISISLNGFCLQTEVFSSVYVKSGRNGGTERTSERSRRRDVAMFSQSRTVIGYRMVRSIIPGLSLVQLVHLFAKLGNGVVVLLPECGHGLFVLQVGLFQVASELGHLGLATLVHLDLGRGGTAGFLKTL